MAHTRKLINFNLTDTASFRVWVQAIHDALAAAGLTQTADTGQIDPATVSFPGSVSTSGGYEIWRFNDAEHGTTPIFFKIEYYRGSSAVTTRLAFTMGTGSNGSGTITNASSTVQLIPDNGASTLHAGLLIVTYNATLGAFSLIWTHDPDAYGGATNAGGHQAGIIIERIRDRATKAYVSGEFMFLHGGSSDNPGWSYQVRTGGAWGTSAWFAYQSPDYAYDDADLAAGRENQLQYCGLVLPRGIRAPLRSHYPSLGTHGQKFGARARIEDDEGDLHEYWMLTGGGGSMKGWVLGE